MSIFRNDTLGSWTRGGQAIVHNVRMTTQVLKQTVTAAALIWLGGTGWYVAEMSEPYQRYVVVKVGEAWLKEALTPRTPNPVRFRTPSGIDYWTRARPLLDSGIAKGTLARTEAQFVQGAIVSGVGTTILLFGAWYVFTTVGAGLGSNQYLRGARFGTRRQLRWKLLWKRKGALRIGAVRVPAAFETEHLLLVGAPGTGKTNLIVKMLDGIRKEGRRAIVYDTAGSFVEKFYRPGRDILLNPLDERSSPWSPWVDVPELYHYDQIAESMIPDKTGDPFWAKAARGTLVAVLQKLARQERTLVSIMLDTLTRSQLNDLAAFTKGTEAAALVSTEGQRTSAGVQAELASVMRSFGYLDDTADGLSIRKWVENEEDDSWLFITAKADQLPSLRPLITVWLDIAISAIMSLDPSRERRLYCVIDELPSLQKLPSLSDFLARARKYGGCGILGFQSYPQLVATYGAHDAAALTGYCSTWVTLRANDTPTAKLVSENLGQVEQIEANEGMSYGVNEMRDGVNLSRMQVTRSLVLQTEITHLPNLTGYLRFGRGLPVIRFNEQFNRVRSIAEPFVRRTRPVVRLEIDTAPVMPVAAEPARKRSRKGAANSAELPLARPSNEASAGKEVAPAGLAYPILAQRAGMRLGHHDRKDGPSSTARPA